MRYLGAMICLSLLMLGSKTMAGNISIQTNVICEGESLTVIVKNIGDEQANDVVVEVVANEKRYMSDKPITILAGGMIDRKFTLEKLEKPGSYVGQVIVSYRDLAGYLFSAPSTFLRQIGVGGHSNLSVRINTPKNGTGKGTVTVINLEPSSIEAKLVFHTAREIRITPSEIVVPLKPSEAKNIEFDVTNIGAIPISHYPLFVILEYDRDGEHCAIAANGIINILEAGATKWWIRIVSVGMICIIGIIGTMWLFRKKKSKAAKIEIQ